MHKKSNSARDSLTLQSSTGALSSFRQPFQQPSTTKMSPTNSPRNYLHIKTARSSISKNLTSDISPTSPKKGFFIKDGFSTDNLNLPNTQRSPIRTNFPKPNLQINNEGSLTTRDSKNFNKQKEIYALSSRKVSLVSNQEEKQLLTPSELNYSPISPRFLISTPRSMTASHNKDSPKKSSVDHSESELKKALFGSSAANERKPIWRHNDVTKFLASSTPQSPKTSRKIRNIGVADKFFWSNKSPKIANKAVPQAPKSARTISQNALTIKIHDTQQNDFPLSTGNTMIDSPKTFWNSINLALSPKEGGGGSIYRSNFQSTMESGPFDAKSLKSWSNLDNVLAKQRSEAASPTLDTVKLSQQVQQVRMATPVVKSSRRSFSGYAFMRDNVEIAHLKTEHNEDSHDFHDFFYQMQEARKEKPQPMALVQKNVYKVDSKRGMTRLQTLPEEADSVHKKIEELQTEFVKTIVNKPVKIERSNADYEEMFKSGGRRLNALDIRTIQLEFAKKAKQEVCEYVKLDSIMNELKFFSNLEKLVRVMLLKSASYKSYNAGEVIFNQGDEGHFLYIILRGAINIKMTRKNKYQEIETVSLGILYDGYHFGENALILNEKIDEKEARQGKVLSSHLLLSYRENKKAQTINPPSPAENIAADTDDDDVDDQVTEKKEEFIEEPSNVPVDEFCEIRAVTAIVSESCDLLCIPRKDYKMICENFIQKYVDQKLRALQTLPFLNELDQYTLLPLANDLVYKKYEYGEIILSAGEEIDRFRIISTGKCSLLLGYGCEASPRNTQKVQTKRFTSGLVDYSCRQTSTRDNSPSSEDKEKERSPKIHQFSKRSFNQEKLGFCEGKVSYLEHLSFGVMAKGGFFGGRALLTPADFSDDEADHEKLPVLYEPARVSVVADSACVEIFELSKENFDSLPDFLGKVIRQGLKMVDEFDNFEIEAKIEQAGQWIKFKEKELKEARISK